MAKSDLEKLMVLIEANTKSYENAMKKVQQQTDKAMKGAANSGKVVDLTLKQIEKGFGRAGNAVAKMEKELAQAAMKATGQVKLNNQQLANMQFQMNDMAVMLASGQNPFTMIMQQGMQIGQLFGPGSSVMGALKATGAGIFAFLTNPINLAIAGFAAATVVIPKIFEAFTGPEAKSAEDTLESLDSLLADLELRYEGVGEAARKMLNAAQSSDVLMAGIQRTEKEIRAGLMKAIEDATLKTKIFSDSWGREVIPERWKDEIEDLGRRLSEGTITVREFRDQMADIRLADNAPEGVKSLADNLLEATEEARKLENALDAVAASADAIGKAVAIDPARFDLNGKSRDEIMAGLRDDLLSQRRKLMGPQENKRGKTVREKQAEIVEREQEAIRKLIDGLRLEHELIGATDLERQKANATRNLGLSATKEQIETIDQLVEATFREKEAFEALESAQNFFADAAFDGLMGIVDGSKSAEDALQDLLKSLMRATMQAMLLGQGPLAGIFGTAGTGGTFGQIMAGAGFGSPSVGMPVSILPGQAGGGSAEKGMPRMVGERGPELFVPHTAGKIVANQNLPGSGKQTNNMIVNVTTPPGHEAQESRRMSGGDEIVDIMIKKVGSTYGLKKPTTKN